MTLLLLVLSLFSSTPAYATKVDESYVIALSGDITTNTSTGTVTKIRMTAKEAMEAANQKRRSSKAGREIDDKITKAVGRGEYSIMTEEHCQEFRYLQADGFDLNGSCAPYGSGGCSCSISWFPKK